MLQTKCITAPPEARDGLRISVMSRHTLRDGRTPDPNITDASYDQWWKPLAPPACLVGSYLREEIDWQRYSAEFEEYLWQDLDAYFELVRLAGLACRQNVTIMCEEATPLHCHRSIIAKRVEQLVPIYVEIILN